MNIQVEDDCHEEGNSLDILTNNNFCFTESDILESVNKVNDTIKNRSTYNIVWNQIKDIDCVEYASSAKEEDIPIIKKVITDATTIILRSYI